MLILNANKKISIEELEKMTHFFDIQGLRLKNNLDLLITMEIMDISDIFFLIQLQQTQI